MPEHEKRVLFVCARNTARSQMAEAFLNHLAPGKFLAESAGLLSGVTLNPLAVDAMWEVGIDISLRHTKSAFDFFLFGRSYNFVITLCDQSLAERCPVFPGIEQRLHWDLPDPASFRGEYLQRLEMTRALRDTIKRHIESFIADPRR